MAGELTLQIQSTSLPRADSSTDLLDLASEILLQAEIPDRLNVAEFCSGFRKCRNDD